MTTEFLTDADRLWLNADWCNSQHGEGRNALRIIDAQAAEIERLASAERFNQALTAAGEALAARALRAEASLSEATAEVAHLTMLLDQANAALECAAPARTEAEDCPSCNRSLLKARTEAVPAAPRESFTGPWRCRKCPGGHHPAEPCQPAAPTRAEPAPPRTEAEQACAACKRGGNGGLFDDGPPMTPHTCRAELARRRLK